MIPTNSVITPRPQASSKPCAGQSKKARDKIHMWTYAGLFYKQDFFMGGNSDSRRIFKRLARLVRSGSFFANLTPIVLEGC